MSVRLAPFPVTDMPLPYLLELTIRLAQGVGRLPRAQRERHTEHLVAQQRTDGGFAGREGESDVYYTGFALRSLALLGQLDGNVADRATQFLRSQLPGSAAVVDLLSLIYGAQLLEASAGFDVFDNTRPGWRKKVAVTLEALRRSDGGYAKSAEGAASSTYTTFLVLLCQQLILAPPVDPDAVVRFVLSQRREDGGFVEIGPMRRSGTNPTAAAIGLLKITDRLTDEVRQNATRFLADAQTDEGGMRANTRIDVADLLSTFTATLTLGDLGGTAKIDTAAAQRYAESLEIAAGGFRAATWDVGSDVEYTFYGLGTLALLSEPGV